MIRFFSDVIRAADAPEAAVVRPLVLTVNIQAVLALLVGFGLADLRTGSEKRKELRSVLELIVVVGHS